MTKRFVLLAVVIITIVSVACDKIDDLLTFYIDEEEEIVVSSNFPFGEVVPLTPVTVTTNSEETFRNNKTRAELVKDVTLNRLSLTVAEPEDKDFNFLKSIEIYVSSEGKEEIRIAYLEDVPQHAKSIELKSTNAKLDEYLKEDTYTIRTQAELAQPVSQNIKIKAAMQFKVTADPI